MKKFVGCGLTQFNVYVTVEAKNKKQARRKIEKFLEDTEGRLDFTTTFQGKRVVVTFDECFEVLDILEGETE